MAPVSDGNATPAAVAIDPALELAFWNSIKDSTDPADFEAYLAQFPQGVFASLAHNRLNRLGASAPTPPVAEAPVAAPPPPPVAPPDAVSTPAASGHDWQTYTNDRHGTRIDYPADVFVPQPPPDNNDGRQFASGDGQSSFYVYAQYNALGQSLKALYDTDRTPTIGEQVTYSKLGGSWFVVSGLRADTIFYRKTILTSDDLIRAFEITYPPALKPMFDAIVPRMAESFGGETPTGADDTSPGPTDTGEPGTGPDGTYASPWGDIVFATDTEGGVTADYEGGQSHLTGQMYGTRFEGIWDEPTSNQQCEDGSYRGRIALDFAADFASFAGLWGYCDDEPNRGVDGTRTSQTGEAAPVAADTSSASLAAVRPAPGGHFGPFATPARGTAIRQAIIDAARDPVSADIGLEVVFVVKVLRSDGNWAYLEATPVQPDGKPLDWTATKLAGDWQSGAMSDAVMVLLNRQTGGWQVVDHVVGPTDVFWYTWLDQYGLPEALFMEQ